MSIPSAFQRHALIAAAALALLALTGPEAGAQQVFRSVGADGRVTFSDRVPSAARGAVTWDDVQWAASPGDTLPPALREVQSRFPVTLYASNDCSPCDSARALLTARGIPFTERTVHTPADRQALLGLSSKRLLPFATIGRQHLDGFDAQEWRQYLDAAGYPQTSALPANYAQTAPRPLAAPADTSAPIAPGPAADAKDATPAPTSRVSPDNPAGLSF